MDGDLFYVLGGLLVAAALVLAFFGIRGAGSFPGNRAMLAGVTGIFAAIVAATMAFAVDLSEEEQAHREHELAAEGHAGEAEAETEAPLQNPGGQPQAAEGGNQEEPETTQATTLDVTSPQDGALVFEPDGLEADPGDVTVTYANPSAVPHSFALENADGDLLGETSVFTNGEESVQFPALNPGRYVFYCTVPGHREGGMEGNLNVLGDTQTG